MKVDHARFFFFPNKLKVKMRPFPQLNKLASTSCPRGFVRLFAYVCQAVRDGI